VNIALLEKRVEQVPPEMLNDKVSMMQHRVARIGSPESGPLAERPPMAVGLIVVKRNLLRVAARN